MLQFVSVKSNFEFYTNHMNGVRVLTVNGTTSEDRVQCSFFGDKRFLNHFLHDTLVKVSNLAPLCTYSYAYIYIYM